MQLRENPDISTNVEGQVLHHYDRDAWTFGLIDQVVFASQLEHWVLVDSIFTASQLPLEKAEILLSNFKINVPLEEALRVVKKHWTDKLVKKHKNTPRTLFKFSGRIWLQHKVIAFWSQNTEASIAFIKTLCKLFEIDHNHIMCDFTGRVNPDFRDLLTWNQVKQQISNTDKKELAKRRAQNHILSPLLKPSLPKQTFNKNIAYAAKAGFNSVAAWNFKNKMEVSSCLNGFKEFFFDQDNF